VNDDELPRPEDLVDEEPHASLASIDRLGCLIVVVGAIAVVVILVLASFVIS